MIGLSLVYIVQESISMIPSNLYALTTECFGILLQKHIIYLILLIFKSSNTCAQLKRNCHSRVHLEFLTDKVCSQKNWGTTGLNQYLCALVQQM